MSFIDTLTEQLLQLAHSVPVPTFTFLGAFIEELIAPIPSPIVMTVAGTIAQAQQQPFTFLLFLAFLGAIGKSIGSYILYVVADKLEDIFIPKFGKFFGITHKEVEAIGKHLSGGIKDDLIIFFARAIPIVPTAPVSIIAGALKMNLRTYLVSGFFGILLRNLFYLYLGYGGLASYETLVASMDNIETIVTVTLALAIAGVVGLIWYSKNKDRLVEMLQQHTLDRKKK